jgi:putative transcriptional regulator
MARIMTYRTQEELAADVHVSRQTISSLENERSLPSVTLAIALARALDTTVEALWG